MATSTREGIQDGAGPRPDRFIRAGIKDRAGRGSDRFIRAGEQCAHCGAPTPLGGTCGGCGRHICTRSARLREMALEGSIAPVWACPIIPPAGAAAQTACAEISGTEIIGLETTGLKIVRPEIIGLETIGLEIVRPEPLRQAA